jgi:hypothetical protein
VVSVSHQVLVVPLETVAVDEGHGLTALEAQCAAAMNAALANAMDTQRRDNVAKKKRDERSTAIKNATLCYLAIAERNRVAGRALDAFYLLAEAAESLGLVGASLEQLEFILADIRSLRDQGVKIENVEPGEILDQQSSLIDQQLQVDLSRTRLNSRLSHLLGGQYACTESLQPVVLLEVRDEPLDREEAIAKGLACRADVGLLMMLQQSLDEETADAVEESLQIAAGLPSIAVASRCGLCSMFQHRDKRAKVQRLHQQIDQVLADRISAATAEILQACDTVETQVQRAANAETSVRNWNDEVQRLEKQRSSPGSGVTVFDIYLARLRHLKARGDRVHHIIAWYIAVAKLKEAQGVLAAECGYVAPSWCSCDTCCVKN